DTAAKSLAATKLGAGAAALPPDALLPRLDSLRGVSDTANRNNADIPWRMRLGLYRGKALGESAHDAYQRELNGVLLPVLASQFAEQVRSNVAVPDRLYEYLKGYLMLGDASHRDADHLRFLTDVELRRMYPSDEATRARLAAHAEQLLGDKNSMSSVAPNTELVE